jgi:hypothetical protein
MVGWTPACDTDVARASRSFTLLLDAQLGYFSATNHGTCESSKDVLPSNATVNELSCPPLLFAPLAGVFHVPRGS